MGKHCYPDYIPHEYNWKDEFDEDKIDDVVSKGNICFSITWPPYENVWLYVKKNFGRFFGKLVFIVNKYIMGKFIITEEEKKRIKGLYEQTTSGDTQTSPEKIRMGWNNY